MDFGVSVSQLYRKICRIGSGVYGVVYKMEDKKHPGSFVALKRCIPHHQASDGYPVTALVWVQVCARCIPANLLECSGFLQARSYQYIGIGNPSETFSLL